MVVKPKPRGKAGRPRTTVPKNSKQRTGTTLNVTKQDRKRIDKLQAMYGLTSGAAAIRWAVRSQLSVLQVKGFEELMVDDIRGQRSLTPLSIWLNEIERKQIAKLRRGYRLESDADAIRIAIKLESKRVGIESA